MTLRLTIQECGLIEESLRARAATLRTLRDQREAAELDHLAHRFASMRRYHRQQQKGLMRFFEGGAVLA